MIVPQFWAEGHARHREHGRQISVRRFGWSDASETEAQANADARAGEALQRLLAGEKLIRREPKIAYNGAQGVPIREEIVERRGETIITRNAYGARCLNTPNVLFVDIDFDYRTTGRAVLTTVLVVLPGAAAAGWLAGSWLLGVVLGVLGTLSSVAIVGTLHGLIQKASGGPERAARQRIGRFAARHPEWSLRVYRTPAGMRVLGTHRTFSPGDPEVAECFAALGADPLYTRMCLNQQCFRARVSAKPWRIGIAEHMRPRPGVWPVAPHRMALRNAWVDKYEAAANAFAACSLIETIGSGAVHRDVRPVQKLHDELCRATSGLPLA
jgi:hypothetical protein